MMSLPQVPEHSHFLFTKLWTYETTTPLYTKFNNPANGNTYFTNKGDFLGTTIIKSEKTIKTTL